MPGVRKSGKIDELVGKWGISQPGAGDALESLSDSETIKRPIKLAKRPGSLQGAALPSNSSAPLSQPNVGLEEVVQECQKSIALQASVMSQDFQVLQNQMEKHQRDQTEALQQQHQSLESRIFMHVHHFQSTIESKIEQEFTKHRLWEAAHLTKSHPTGEQSTNGASTAFESGQAKLLVTSAVADAAQFKDLSNREKHDEIASGAETIVRFGNQEPETSSAAPMSDMISHDKNISSQAAADDRAEKKHNEALKTNGSLSRSKTAIIAEKDGHGLERERKKLARFVERMRDIRRRRARSAVENMLEKGHVDLDWLDRMKEKPYNRITWIADSQLFGIFGTVLILTNSAWIGYQTNHVMHHILDSTLYEVPGWQMDVNLAYAILLAVEILIRVAAYGSSFFIGTGWEWNCYDLLVVTVAVTEECLSSLDLSWMRALRVFRVIRVVRVIRMLRFFMHFRHMMCTVIACTSMLLWTLVLVAFFVYLVAVIFMQGIILFADKSNTQLLIDLTSMYGSVPRAMYTLLQAITSGRPWMDIVDPLSRMSHIFTLIFCAYLMFVMFGVFNVLTGVFVVETERLKDRDRDLSIHREIMDAESFSEELKSLFWDHGIIQGDQISVDAFGDAEMEDIEIFLQSHGLDSTDAHELFILMDTEGTGQIHFEDFVFGCLRLKAQVKGMDIVLMHQEVLALKNKMTENRETMIVLKDLVQHTFLSVHQDSKRLRSEVEQAAAAIYVEAERMKSGRINDHKEFVALRARQEFIAESTYV